MTVNVTEVLGGCNTIVTPPGRVQLENVIFTTAIRIVVHEGGVKATLIVCCAQPWDKEGAGSSKRVSWEWGESRMKGVGTGIVVVSVVGVMILVWWWY